MLQTGTIPTVKTIAQAISDLLTAIKDTEGIKRITDKVTVGLDQIESQPVSNPLPVTGVIGGKVVASDNPLFAHDWENKGALGELVVEAKRMNEALSVIIGERIKAADIEED